MSEAAAGDEAAGTYHYVDPAQDIAGGAETGTAPAPKSWSYYKRSWTSGKSYSKKPVWSDMDLLPPSRRDAIARPDLALNAMKRILNEVENDRGRGRRSSTARLRAPT